MRTSGSADAGKGVVEGPAPRCRRTPCSLCAPAHPATRPTGSSSWARQHLGDGTRPIGSRGPRLTDSPSPRATIAFARPRKCRSARRIDSGLGCLNASRTGVSAQEAVASHPLPSAANRWADSAVPYLLSCGLASVRAWRAVMARCRTVCQASSPAAPRMARAGSAGRSRDEVAAG
jgi:hypothetical protein